MPAPLRVSIPLILPDGTVCLPLAGIGDRVDKGQCIGMAGTDSGCPIHASISGYVSAVEERCDTAGRRVPHLVIENDGEDRLSPQITPFSKRLGDTTADELIEIIRQAGITDTVGSHTPLADKIRAAMGHVSALIVNGAESEPYVTAGHRLLLERPDAVINGVKILLKALSVRQGWIAVEDNKLNAINKLEAMLTGSELIKVQILKAKYPQENERLLTYAVTGRELAPGKPTSDAECVIFGTAACAAVFDAFAQGMPFIERTVTVDGDCVGEPGNIVVPFGTSFADVIDFCGGLKKRPAKVIAGGPMTGLAQEDINVSTTRDTSAILILSRKYTDTSAPAVSDTLFGGSSKIPERPAVCIRCGRCVSVCPMRLMPLYLASYAREGNAGMCETFDIGHCVECGTCAYVCPGRVPLVKYIREGKEKIRILDGCQTSMSPAGTADSSCAAASVSSGDDRKSPAAVMPASDEETSASISEKTGRTGEEKTSDSLTMTDSFKTSENPETSPISVPDRKEGFFARLLHKRKQGIVSSEEPVVDDTAKAPEESKESEESEPNHAMTRHEEEASAAGDGEGSETNAPAKPVSGTDGTAADTVAEVISDGPHIHIDPNASESEKREQRLQARRAFQQKVKAGRSARQAAGKDNVPARPDVNASEAEKSDSETNSASHKIERERKEEPTDGE